MSLTGAEIRERFINYFQNKHGHLHLPSASLIPDNPTLLLTSAGMVPFVPIFLGQAPPTDPPRAVTVQKVTRAGGKDSDIENIGRTQRHHSFFEMLGNFSFGDYFKNEVIPWAWEFVTEELGLEKDRLYVTVFSGNDQVPADDEAFQIWHKVIGLTADRIGRRSAKDNFWGPPGPTGPCGPCTEIFYDRGPEFGAEGFSDEDSERYVEIWNLVFMELFKDEQGRFKPLDKKNVDTGAGLERMATVIQKAGNSFETDLLFPILEEVAGLAGKKYVKGEHAVESKQYKINLSLKIITDHARCVTFLICDGVRPSNLGRGYVLRFIIRRAARFGRLIGLEKPFLSALVPKIVEIYQGHYKELSGKEHVIASVIADEENRFAKTIDRGMTILEDLLKGPDREIPGKVAFNLYATYGFPIELTEEIAREKGMTVDRDAFSEAKKEHEKVSSVGKFNVIITGEEALGKLLSEHGQTRFAGYGNTRGDASLLAVIKDGKLTDRLSEGEEAEVVLDQTPFYAESGGQLGDQGTISNKEANLAVLDTQKHEGLHVHKVRALAGEIETESRVKAEVDEKRREATMLHHSAAHLFHAAIRQILGDHVLQAGSQVGPQTMRFDFSFERQVSAKELSEIESLMNEWVRNNYPVKTVEMSLDEAKKTGAIAMFGEKYGDIVRVVKMGDFSLEFCGGTHVQATGDIGPVKIISESSISSGTRRVEALAGLRSWNYISRHMNILNSAAAQLKIKPEDLLSQIDRLQDQIKQKDKLAQSLEEKLAFAKAAELLAGAEPAGEFRVISKTVSGLSPEALKSLVDFLRSKDDDLVVVLGTVTGADKVSLAAGVSDPLIAKGIKAGDIIKKVASICGGSGGGRPQLAQAGGKSPSRLDEALGAVKELVMQTVNA